MAKLYTMIKSINKIDIYLALSLISNSSLNRA